MNAKQIEKHIFSGLHDLGWWMSLMKEYDRNRDQTICACQHYMFIFDRLIRTFPMIVVMQILAMTDPTEADGLTMTKWLSMLINSEADEEDLKTLKKARKLYRGFLASPEYRGFKVRRDKYFAHHISSRPAWGSIPGKKMRDLYKGIQVLQEIYDTIASAGGASRTVWTGKPDPKLYNNVDEEAKNMSPEETMKKMMLVLEASCHKQSWHEHLNKASPNTP